MHYSLAHSPVSMNKWDAVMARKIAKQYKDSNKYPVFTYRGMSGVATVTALVGALARLKDVPVFAMLYCRKYDEVTNGNCFYEYTVSDPIKSKPMNAEFVFVDDFICSGESLAECARIYASKFDKKFNLTGENFAILSGSSGDWSHMSEAYRIHRTKKYMNPIYFSDPQKVGMSFSMTRAQLYLTMTAGRKISKRSSYKKLIHKS